MFPQMLPLNLVDTKFQALKLMETPPFMIPQWMSETFLWIIYMHAAHSHWLDHNQNMSRTLTRSVHRSLGVYAHRISKAAATEIGACLDLPQGNTSDLQGAY